MKEMLIKRIGNLMTIKSIVTIALTILFCVMSLKGVVSQEVNNIFLIVIGFYFGSKASQQDNSNKIE